MDALKITLIQESAIILPLTSVDCHHVLYYVIDRGSAQRRGGNGQYAERDVDSERRENSRQQELDVGLKHEQAQGERDYSGFPEAAAHCHEGDDNDGAEDKVDVGGVHLVQG